MRIDEALRLATAKISSVCENPARVAKILLMHHLGVSIEWIFLNLSKELEDKSGYFALVDRFASYEPLEYITGKASFYGFEFEIQSGVLVPRPETEILVDKSLEILREYNVPKVCEIGVGSGIISVCLALNSNALITATDISEKALKLAHKNAVKFGVEKRINFVKCAYMDEIKGEFDLVVSNPPYIAQDYELSKFVLNEPHEALFGGKVGDEILKNIILQTRNRKVKYLICEMGYDQKESMTKALEINKFDAKFYKDLAGFDRGFVANFKYQI
ncbi:peptide chain release factor N(5)-glutamine methyltransferase [Campylobacter sp. RM16187]|uniref:peptide chain release factor N(5)-glutamine methyltransferase n=1 Tax=Campylobacter sp. RM16187 TaxID=1660063 RepID=UPI0021B54996|nr:peptide chain release factor N(5)-glutamine methyltransferase [Campylobacter sp. RM16187]QKG29522.1 protein-(glutamine-N5) methyltransferase [Campylobacter sp. RM16187]